MLIAIDGTWATGREEADCSESILGFSQRAILQVMMWAVKIIMIAVVLGVLCHTTEWAIKMGGSIAQHGHPHTLAMLARLYTSKVAFSPYNNPDINLQKQFCQKDSTDLYIGLVGS